MADSTVSLKPAEIPKLKVVELKRELKARGLSTTGDKALLVQKLLEAVADTSATHQEQDHEHDITEDIPGEDALDSDEIDSDAVLQDDDDDDDIIVAATPAATATSALKRKAAAAVTSTLTDAPEPPPEKKIHLNRTPITAPATVAPVPVTAPTTTPAPATTTTATPAPETEEPKGEDAKIKTTAEKLILNPQTKLELRAKRFGLPLAGDAAKEARKARFGGATITAPSSGSISVSASVPSADAELLKKRAERFGVSVSKAMIDIERKEKLERRKAKFGMVS